MAQFIPEKPPAANSQSPGDKEYIVRTGKGFFVVYAKSYGEATQKLSAILNRG